MNWIPLTMAAAGALLLVGGLFVSLGKSEKSIFTDEPIETVEKLGLYAMALGIVMLVAANVLSYYLPEGA